MAVYVDSECNRFGRMIMCYMFADTSDELHSLVGRTTKCVVYRPDEFTCPD